MAATYASRMSRRHHPPRFRRILWITASLLALFTVGGFFLLPPFVKSQLQQRLSAELGRTVTIGQVRINPYELSISLEDFDLREPDGQTSFVSWRRLHVNFEALASFGGHWVLGAIDLDGLQAAVQVQPDGSLNFSDLLAKLTAAPTTPASPAAPTPPPGRAVQVGRLSVTQARVTFTDRSRPKPFTSVVGPLTFAVSGFHTGGISQAPYRFEAATETSEKFSWSGSLQAAPFRSSGEFRIENVPLAKYAPYHGPLMQADVTDGKLSLRGRYEVNLAQATRVLRLLEGALQLRSLRVLERASQEPVFELPLLDIGGIHADALTRKVELDTISLVGAYLRTRREKDGTLNLVSILRAPSAGPAPQPASAAPPAAPAPPPEVRIGEVSLRECAVDAIDLAAPRPVWLGLTGLQLSLKGLTLADGAKFPVQLAFKWAPRGTVRLDGHVAIKPTLQATLQTQIAGLDFLPLSPYLEQFVNARITQGTLSTTHTLQLSLTAGAPAVTFAGGVRIEKFGLVDAARNEEIAGVGTLALSGVKVSTAPRLTVAVTEVNLTAPYLRVIVNSDKTVNLAALAPPAAPGTAPVVRPPAAAAPVPPAPPRLDIGKVVLSEGNLSLMDFTVEPHVRTVLGQFGGTVTGLSSENLARADVALRGTVDNAGPVAITGRLDPLGASRFVDLTVACQNVDLVAFSPYSGKFAGFELARGKLGADLHLLIDGPKLTATNVVRLDRLTFGAPVASAEATKLPVRLGVALLKDLDGRIVIDLPIQGRLDDPEFKVGRVIGRVLINLLSKAAVSPFKLLGSMFGGGGDELAFQDFAPGRSTLQPAEIAKLATLIKVLGNRPELSLALEGSCDTAADTHALKRVKLDATIRRTFWEQKHVANSPTPPPAQLAITPAEEAATIKALYDQRFPPGTEFGTPLPQPPEVVKPPEPPAGLLQRFVRSLTGRAKLEQAAAQAENERRAAEHRLALEKAITSSRPVDEMLGRLAEVTEVTSGDLAALAAARAQSVRDHFVLQGQIAADRLFLARGSDAAQGTKGPRVFLSLQ